MNNEHEEENSMRKKNNSKTAKPAVKPVEVKKEETVAHPAVSRLHKWDMT